MPASAGTFALAMVLYTLAAVVGGAAVFFATRRVFDELRSRGYATWLAVPAALVVGAVVFLGGWVGVLAWWLGRRPYGWLTSRWATRPN